MPRGDQMQDDHLAQPSAAVRLRLEGPIFALVEDWRRSHEKIPSRSEALRLPRVRAGPDRLSCGDNPAPLRTSEQTLRNSRRFGRHRRLKNQNPRGACARAWLIKTSATLLLIQPRPKLQAPPRDLNQEIVQMKSSSTTKKSWRQWLRIHPAAELFPPLSKQDLRALADDIKQYGLRQPVSFIRAWKAILFCWTASTASMPLS